MRLCHGCPRLYLIKNGVTDTEDVDYNGVFQQRQQVVGHALPEVEQKILDLQNKFVNQRLSAYVIIIKKFLRHAGDHLLKVDVNGVVQDALAVGFVHHDQSVHLRRGQ